MNRIERDQHTIRLMVDLYCRKRLHLTVMPADYQALADYACRRLAHCRWGEEKPACKDCPVHCYAPEMRRKMQEVMRWTGPRMLWYSPRATFRHFWQSLKEKTSFSRRHDGKRPR